MDSNFNITGQWTRVKTDIIDCIWDAEDLTFDSDGWVTWRGVNRCGDLIETKMNWKIEGSSYKFICNGRPMWTGMIENDSDDQVVLQPLHGFKSIFARK
jgi:hypothetical protein